MMFKEYSKNKDEIRDLLVFDQILKRGLEYADVRIVEEIDEKAVIKEYFIDEELIFKEIEEKGFCTFYCKQ